LEARDPALSRADKLRVAPALAVSMVLFGGALIGALKVSLIPLGGGAGDATLDSWTDLLRDPAFRDGLFLTLRIAAVSTVLAAVAGLGLAMALRRHGTTSRAVASLPIPIPHLLVAVIAVVWLGPGGLADRTLGVLPFDVIRDGGGLGVIGVYVYKEAPFIALLVLGSMGTALAEREEAAAVLGVDRLHSTAWVLWPAVRRPLVIGSVIVAAFAIGAFEVPLAIGPNYPPALSAYAFEATSGDVIAGEGRAAAALLIAGLLATVLALVAVRVARGVDDA